MKKKILYLFLKYPDSLGNWTIEMNDYTDKSSQGTNGMFKVIAHTDMAVKIALEFLKSEHGKQKHD